MELNSRTEIYSVAVVIVKSHELAAYLLFFKLNQISNRIRSYFNK